MPIEITMPRLSDTMESGTIIKWGVAEGDAVSAGDVVADVETDKATMEMPVFDDGVIAKILIDEGQTVDVGAVIAVLAEEDEDPAEVAKAASNGAMASGESLSEADSDAAPTAADALVVERDGPVRVSPVARRLIEEHGLDAARIQGSGPGGRIIKRDVLQAVEARDEMAASIPPSAMARREAHEAREAPAAAMPVVPVVSAVADESESQTIALSNMRQTIARRLVESKQTIPHYQITAICNADPLIEMRRSLNEQLEAQQVKLSLNDFLVRAAALAIQRHPEFNASWAGDSIVVHGDINVGVAIALPRERGGGLVVATIRRADRISLREISSLTRELAEKARTRGLAVEEMADATFTISNLGMFGVDTFNAIINPPNSAILAVGGAIQKPVVRDGELTIGHEMSCTLSLDHRVIDGATGAQFMQNLRQLIEHPATLLV